MLHYFSAKNFSSFEDKVTVDFRVDDNTPDRPSYTKTESGTKLSLVEAVVGPNAAGKTTVLKALSFLQWMICESYRQDYYKLPFMPFAGNSNSKTPTEFETVFETKEGIFIYSLVVNQFQVLSEELSIKAPSSKRVTTKKLFSRTWVQEKEAFEVIDRGFNLPEVYWRKKELKDATILSSASRFGHEQASRITAVWDRFKTNVEVYDSSTQSRYIAYQAIEYYRRHPEAKRIAEKSVRSHDLGIEGFTKDGRIKHRLGDKTFKLDLDQESSGTMHFLAVTRLLEQILHTGGVAVIDEFDAYIHPKVFESLLKKVLDPKVNIHQAQVLISTHDLQIFNLVDAKHQIILVEKNDRGATTIKRLSSLRVRADVNHLNRYLSGDYGALPKVP